MNYKLVVQADNSSQVKRSLVRENVLNSQNLVGLSVNFPFGSNDWTCRIQWDAANHLPRRHTVNSQQVDQIGLAHIYDRSLGLHYGPVSKLS